jgi:hypothetical protein
MKERTVTRKILNALVLLLIAVYLIITRISLEKTGCVRGRFTVACRGTDPTRFYRSIDGRLLAACGSIVWAGFQIVALIRDLKRRNDDAQ